MTLRIRRILYITLIVAFFILAPVIVLYTAGYRYNFKKYALEKTGIIFISTVPSTADIYLDGKKVADKTPFIVRNLFPGDYEIKIESPEHLSWNKKLSVQSRLTTFINELALLKKSPPTIFAPGIITAQSISPDKKYIAYAKKEKSNELYVLDAASGEAQKISGIAADDTAFVWPAGGNWLVAEKRGQIAQLFRKGGKNWNPVSLTGLP
ncbi:MAG: PEGA domain-containing protein, partial [Patescibacteria group bacterium]